MTSTLSDGFLFLHVPKTGGCWVWETLHKQGLLGQAARHEHVDLAYFGDADAAIGGVGTPCHWALRRIVPAEESR
ncbi:MAG: hypothetical protein AAGK14_06925 [Verrucomicrobiota bacterium]